MNAMIGNSLLLSSGGYKISRSVRLRSGVSAYLNRTPSVASNRRTWTWSGWIKRGALGLVQYVFFGGTNATNYSGLAFNGDQFFVVNVVGGASTLTAGTSAVFRDPSSWYHFVVAVDTTQAINSNGVKIWVNGVQQTLTFTTYTQNTTTQINNNIEQSISGSNAGARVQYFDGYLTEINFIDGQALTPSSFGQTDPTTGVWQPIAYSGTYGTNGFYLNFSDNSAATAAAIGKDYSGNGNNWTPNNISVTAGATYDSMLDVPTMWADGGNGRGNYAVLNPLDILERYVVGTSSITNGNLTITAPNGSSWIAHSSIWLPLSGKYYFEVVVASSSAVAQTQYFGAPNALYDISGQRYKGSWAAYGASYTTNDVLGCAIDIDSSTVEFFKNGVSQGVITAAPTAGGFVMAGGAGSASGAASYNVNFGQRPFVYTPPTGFKALNTLNLPTPTIVKGNQYFDATTYTATGTTPQTITNSGGMQPNLLWTKPRSSTGDHALIDSARGVSQYLISNLTNAEASAPNYLLSFNSNGFSLGSANWPNGTTVVGWQWKETPVAGFDIVTYTGTGVARTIAHNLGVAPKMMIVKGRSAVSSWGVWHDALSATEYLLLESTSAKAPSATVWDGTLPTLSVFSVGADLTSNGNGRTLVAYLFAEVEGFSKFGSYIGNGSPDGPFLYCGFRPRFVMFKSASGGVGSWIMMDTERSPYNLAINGLLAESAVAELPDRAFDILSNGAKIRGGNANGSGVTYIFAAFAENPFKYALAR
jgi:hypothetical protein